MPRFTYVARRPDGTRVVGHQRARTLGQVRRGLATAGLRSLQITEQSSRWNRAITNERVSRRRRRMLVHQLRIFVTNGIPVLDGLSLLADETDDRITRRALLAVIDEVKDGTSLAAALTTREELLAPHQIALVRAAEATGRLADALSDIERDVARDIETREALRSAATYPIIVLALAVVTVSILAIVVLPRFAALFDDLGTTPPPVTRFLLAVVSTASDLPPTAWAAAILVMATAIGVTAQPSMAPRRHRLTLSTPVIGGLVRRSAEERMCRVLAISLRSGVPLPTAVGAARDALHNEVLRQRLEVAQGRILAGSGLSRSLEDLDVLSPTVQQLLTVGEATGTVAQQLEVSATHVSDDLRRRIASATALLEPAMIVMVGGVVGFVAIALVSAMYGLIGDLDAGSP